MNPDNSQPPPNGPLPAPVTADQATITRAVPKATTNAVQPVAAVTGTPTPRTDAATFHPTDFDERELVVDRIDCAAIETELVSSEAALKAANERLAEMERANAELRDKLMGEIIGIPADVNTVRWAKKYEKEKADHLDTQRKWNEAMDLGFQAVEDAESASSELAKITKINDDLFARCMELSSVAQQRDALQSRLTALESVLQSIVDGCVNPDTAIRRVMVDLAPIRAVLGKKSP